jgi:predicted RNA polymerase sigma factor
MAEMPERIDAVLTVIYLIFNEGYASTRGESLVRADLCAEAIRLARLIRMSMAPYAPEEATGLLALMLLHDSRRKARVNEADDLIVLEEQDRSLWDQGKSLKLCRSLLNLYGVSPHRLLCKRRSPRNIAARFVQKTPTGPPSCGYTIYC